MKQEVAQFASRIDWEFILIYVLLNFEFVNDRILFTYEPNSNNPHEMNHLLFPLPFLMQV